MAGELKDNAYLIDANKSPSGFGKFFGDMVSDFISPNTTSRIYNSYEADKNRQWLSDEAEKARKYDTEMSNTAYQRAFEDIRKTGLNPYIVFSHGGSGASSPSSPLPSSSSAFSSSTGQNIFARAQQRKEDNKKAVFGLVGSAFKLLSVLNY